MSSLTQIIDRIKDRLRDNRLYNRRLLVIVFLAIVAVLSLFVIQQNLNISKRASEGGFGRDIWGLAYRIECSRRAQEKFADLINTADREKKREINAFFDECILSLTSDPTPTPTGSVTATPTPTGSTNPTPTVTPAPTLTGDPAPTLTSTPTPTSGASSVVWGDKFEVGRAWRFPSLVVDKSGKTHYTWWDPVTYDIWYRVCGPSINSCNTAQKLSQDGIRSYYSSIDLDSGDKPHIVWSSNLTSEGYTIYYSKYGGNSWSLPRKVSSELDSELPRIVIDASNKIHLTYQSKENNSGSIYYTSSSDGVNWSTHQKLGTGFYPAISLDSNNKPYVAWNGLTPGGIFYKHLLDGANWSSQINVSTGHKDQTPDIVVDKQNFVHLVWTKYDALKISYARFKNDEKIESKDDLGGNIPKTFWPKLALDESSSLHLVFQGRPVSPYGIYYRSLKSGTWSSVKELSMTSIHQQTPDIAIRGSVGAVTYFDSSKKLWAYPFRLE